MRNMLVETHFRVVGATSPGVHQVRWLPTAAQAVAVARTYIHAVVHRPDGSWLGEFGHRANIPPTTRLS